jgi:hypothetical protein
MRWLTLVGLLAAGCGHGGGDAASAVAALVGVLEVPVLVAQSAHGIEDCAQHPHEICQPPRPDLAPYLRGTVVFSGPLGLDPVPFTEVILVRDGVTLRSAATDRHGVFYFSCGLAPGPYDLVVQSSSYLAARRLFVDGPERQLLLMATRR